MARSDPADLTLAEAASRTCWLTVHGAVADAPHRENLRRHGVATPAEVVATVRPGGITLFAWAENTAHPAQVARLAADLRAVAAADGWELGVTLDEEGGRVQRLGLPATAFPSARAVAQAGDAGLATARWSAAGAELAALGITADLAPVVDLATTPNPVIGDRSPGADPHAVAREAAVAVSGLQAAGVAAVAKHFPGHGATATDSHLDLPVVAGDRTELDVHLAAFSALFAATPPAGVMAAHLRVPAVDPDHVTTVSRRILTDLLRGELGYDGAVLTDALAMAGIRAVGDDAAVCTAALAAGADVLLDPGDVRAAVAGIADAVRGGRLERERLDDALRRSAPLRRAPTAPPEGLAVVGAPGHRRIAAAIARDALWIDGALPTLGDGPVLVAGVRGSGARPLADLLRDRGVAAGLLELAATDPGAQRLAAGGLGGHGPALPADRTLPAGSTAGTTLVAVRRAPEVPDPGQDPALDQLVAAHDGPVVAVEAGTEGRHWGEVAVVTCWGADTTAIEAVADALAPRAAAIAPRCG